MLLFSQQGITRDHHKFENNITEPWYYEQLELGYNYRLSDIHAALGLNQLKRLDNFIAQRHVLAKRYDKAFSDLPIKTLVRQHNAQSALHLYVIRILSQNTNLTRLQVYQKLLDQGIVDKFCEFTHMSIKEFWQIMDKWYNLELFELCLLNKCEEALKVYDNILQNGVQPVQIISNLLEISHLASRISVIKFDPNITEALQKSISEISSHGLPKLVKLWQILIKSVEELRYAPNEQQAGSMAIIKLCYGSLMPDPIEFLEKISNQTKINLNSDNDKNVKKSNIENNLDEVKTYENQIKNVDVPKTFDEMLNLLLVNKEALLHAQLINNVHLISYSEGSIKIRLKDNTDSEILKKLSSTLGNITKTSWVISQSEEEGEKTIIEKQNSELDKNKEQIKSNPHFAEVFKHFPQAEITSIEDKDSN